MHHCPGTGKTVGVFGIETPPGHLSTQPHTRLQADVGCSQKVVIWTFVCCLILRKNGSCQGPEGSS